MSRTRKSTKGNAQQFKGKRGSSNYRAKGPMSRKHTEDWDETEGRVASNTNDVSWYSKYGEFARDAATIPFSRPLGTPIDVFSDDTITENNQAGSTPGIMRIGFAPCIGNSKDYTSPINKSSIQYFTYQRSIQKASWDYDHQDVTIGLLALDSCYMFHALMRRAYNTMNLFTPLNMYYPRALVRAMGFDFDDIFNKMAEFRAYINEFGLRLQQYVMPDNFTLIDRHQWMCSGIYTDSHSSRAQTYVFTPDVFWKYNSTNGSLSSKGWVSLTTDPSSAGVLIYHKLNDVIEFGDDLMNAISNDEDLAFISGDMYNMFGRGRAVPVVNDLDTIVPSYDNTVLTQIENATVMGYFYPQQTITQDPTVNNGAIISTIRVVANNSEVDNAAKRVVINMHEDQPTPAMVMEATRLTATSVVEKTENETFVYIDRCGTEFVTQLKILSYTKGSTTTGPTLNTTGTASSVIHVLSTDYLTRLAFISDISQFDWAPLMFITADDSAGRPISVGAVADIDNFTSIEDPQLSMLHTAALYSLFDIPSRRSAKE